MFETTFVSCLSYSICGGASLMYIGYIITYQIYIIRMTSTWILYSSAHNCSCFWSSAIILWLCALCLPTVLLWKQLKWRGNLIGMYYTTHTHTHTHTHILIYTCTLHTPLANIAIVNIRHLYYKHWCFSIQGLLYVTKYSKGKVFWFILK